MGDWPHCLPAHNNRAVLLVRVVYKAVAAPCVATVTFTRILVVVVILKTYHEAQHLMLFGNIYIHTQPKYRRMEFYKNGKDYRFVGTFGSMTGVENCLALLRCNDHIVVPYDSTMGKDIKMYKLYVVKKIERKK